MDPRLFPEQKKSEPFKIFNHFDHLKNLVALMQQSTIEPTNEADKKSAENQLAFAIKASELLEKIIKIPKENILEKRFVGIELCEVNNKFFGVNEVPTIQGEKSKAFAALLSQHFRDLEKVQFNPDEVYWSNLFSKIPFINIRSIPDQVKHHRDLADKIDKQIEVYEKSNGAEKVITELKQLSIKNK